MTLRQAGFLSPASSAELSVSSFLASSRTLSGRRAQPARAERRACWHAAAVGVCALLLLSGVAVSANAQNVSFAGTQSTINVLVASTGLSFPNGVGGVAVDQAGDIFIADAGHNRVVKIPAGGGAQTTVPTNGLNNPQGVAVDGSGNVFIADTGNNRVVEVPWNGTSYGAQTTLAVSVGGLGLNNPQGVAVDNNGSVYIADTNNNRVVEIPWDGSAQTTVGSGLNKPCGAATDSSRDIVIADTGNSRVVELPSFSGATQTTVPVSGLGKPQGVAMDWQGNILIADTQNNRVVEVPAWNGATYGPQTTVGSGLNDPLAVGVDGTGDVFIVDTTGSEVVKVRLQAVNFGSANVCPSGQTTPAPCSNTLALTYNVNADTTLSTTPAVLTQGASNLDFTLASGSTCAGAVTAGSTCTVNVTFAPRVPGLRMGAVQLSDSSGNLLVTTLLSGVGQGPAIAFGPGTQTTLIITVRWGLYIPQGVAVDAAGDVFIADTNHLRVVEIPAGGGAQTEQENRGDTTTGVAVDGAGNFFASGADDGRVSEYPSRREVDSGLGFPTQLAVDGAGDLFIADSHYNEVLEVPWTGTSYGQQTTVASGLNGPYGVAVDGAGNVFIGDTGNNRVVEVPAGGGAQITVISSGLNGPQNVAVDAAGDLFIADTGNNRVVELPAGGGALTTVGSGLSGPYGVAVDAAGDVFIADTGNNRVVEVQMSQAPSLSFATTLVDATSNDSPQSVTAQNIGNATLNAVAPGLSVSPNSFVQVAGPGTPSDCTSGFSLAPGASCNLSIDFTPQIAGSLTGSATFTDNALNATAASQSVGLSGTGQGQAPFISSAASVTFSESQANSFTVTTMGFLSAPAITELGTLPYGVLFIDNHDGTATLAGIPAIGSLTTYTITITASNATPQSATQSFTLTITSAPLSLLTITASSATMTYGGTVPTITAIYSLVSPTLTGLICSTQATSSSPVGTYISSCTGAVGNYAISYATGTVTVGPATLSASIINNPTKPYDGTNTATLGSSNFQLTGLLPGQSITETVTVTGTYASVNAGTSIPVSANLVSGDFTAGGSTQLSNYTLPTTASGTGQITALTLSAAIVGNPTKSYDGTTTATLGSSNFQLTGLLTGESITVTQTAGAYNYPDVATATTVTASLGSGNFTPDGSTLLTNYVLPTTASGPGQITAATATVTLSNLTQTYTGSPLTPTATTTPTGLAINWTGAPDTSADSYAVTATVNDPNYQGSASGTFLINKTVATVTLSNLTQTYTGSPLTPMATTTPPGLTIVWTGAPDTNVGSYAVTATVNDPNYQGSASGTFNISKAAATVTLSNLTQTYTGSPLTPTATTTPTGLAIVWTGAPDTSVGSYAVTATVNDPNYQGSASGAFNINKAAATVTLSKLTQTYTGSPLTPTATTTPTGLAIVWTGAPDTNPGSYAVTASVNNPNYQGSASGTFTVGQAPAITSANTTTFTVGMPGSFTVTTTGFPVAGITEVGGLPSGVSFVDNHNGTAMLSGTPATGSNPTYNMTITANNGVSPNATQSFTLAVATLNISPASVNFGTVYLEQEGVQFVTLTNTGDMPISISSINVAAPGNALRDFGDITTCTPFIRRLPGTLGAGQSCMIAVRFAAEVKIFSPTLSTATLLIADNAVGSPQSVGLSATVINPRASLSPTRLNFSTQKEGSSTTKTVTLTNTGNTSLTLGTLSISGDFAIAPSPATTCADGGTVEPSTSCVISVTFTPEAKGDLTGRLEITDNARNSPQRVRLRGKGD